MTPEERLVRGAEQALREYDETKAKLGARPGPAWLERSIAEMRESIAEYRRTHPLVEETPSITCPRCWRTSYHPKDIDNSYCASCGFWGDGP